MSVKRKIDIDSLPHYTVDDWKEWEGEWELIDGIPHAMAPMPTVRHQVVSGNAYRHFSELLDPCADCNIYLPINLRVDEFTVLHPDLSIACGTSPDGVFFESVPALVIEILSPSTAFKDRNSKSKAYAKLGIQWYLIVDPVDEYAEIWRLNGDSFEFCERLKTGTFDFDLGKCKVTADFSKIW
jgi:Uma2 family endonuclease